jgi:hypothetical protein
MYFFALALKGQNVFCSRTSIHIFFPNRMQAVCNENFVSRQKSVPEHKELNSHFFWLPELGWALGRHEEYIASTCHHLHWAVQC